MKFKSAGDFGYFVISAAMVETVDQVSRAIGKFSVRD